MNNNLVEREFIAEKSKFEVPKLTEKTKRRNEKQIAK